MKIMQVKILIEKLLWCANKLIKITEWNFSAIIKLKIGFWYCCVVATTPQRSEWVLFHFGNLINNIKREDSKQEFVRNGHWIRERVIAVISNIFKSLEINEMRF